MPLLLLDTSSFGFAFWAMSWRGEGEDRKRKGREQGWDGRAGEGTRAYMRVCIFFSLKHEFDLRLCFFCSNGVTKGFVVQSNIILALNLKVR